jgi:hypothetical protein
MEALDPMAIQELTYMFQQNSRLPMPFKVVLKKATFHLLGVKLFFNRDSLKCPRTRIL